MKKFMVIEDNAGGLTLIVFAKDGETIEYLHSGYEYYPGELSENLKNLKNGENPAREWDGNFLDDEETIAEMSNPNDLESWFPYEQHRQAWNIVADNKGIYPESMGTSAKLEFEQEKGL